MATEDTTSTKEPRRVGWLQLTDLHVGQPKEGGRLANIEREFLADLTEQSKREELAFELVFFTGDIAFRGTHDEYLRASAMLGRILAHIDALNRELGKPAPILIPTPGNHDLARPAPHQAALVQAALANRTPGSPRLWSDGESAARDVLDRCFAPYEQWLRHHPMPFPRDFRSGGLFPGDRRTSIDRGGVRIGVVCLNSAALHLGDAQPGSMHLELAQLNTLVGPNPQRWLEDHDFTLLLTHHPPSWLSEHAQKILDQEIKPDALFDLHLYGHTHLGGHHTDAGMAGVRHLLEGRSLFGAEEDGLDRLHGYTLGRFSIDHAGKHAEFWSRQGWQTGHGYRFGPGDSTWGRWRVVIDLGRARPSPATTDSKPRRWERKAGNLEDRGSWISVASDGDLADLGIDPARRWVMLSCSIPEAKSDPERRAKEAEYLASSRPEQIRKTVALLAAKLRAAGIGLVFGGHPSITSILAQEAMKADSELRSKEKKAKEDVWLLLVQDDRYWYELVEETGVLIHAKGVRGILVEDRPGADGLERMRKVLSSIEGLAAAVFVGGMSGVVREFEICGNPRPPHDPLPRVAVGVGGGAAAKLLLERGDAARGETTSRGPIEHPDRLWYTPEAAVAAILGLLGIAAPAT